MANQPKNYGFKISDIKDERAHVMGSLRSLPAVVLQADGQWDAFLPAFEAQNVNFEEYGCTVWGSENGYEILLKRIKDGVYNFSERFIYILADIKPPGADPHEVLEVMRNNGLIPEVSLPMTQTYTEFITPKPMTQNYLDEGKNLPYALYHEWVINGVLAPYDQKNKMKEALTYSPLCVGVYAWNEQGGIYIRSGEDSHWTVIFGYEEGLFWKCFDSYDSSIKHLDWNFGFKYVKRLHVDTVAELQAEVSWLTIIRDFLLSLILWVKKNK